MPVVATAGHVDHGKSTLVRALTGREPDRWAEERRRGLTIDLGYAWMTLPDGRSLAFVDVPGHEHFIGNMLAGLGPAPAVMFVVAADQGWREQSQEHLAAVDALRLRHGLLVVTRSDLADPGPVLDQARARLASSSLGEVPAVAVSGRTGAGLDQLRRELSTLAAALPAPSAEPVRFWIDRAFTVRGAGTVVTGTLGAGTITVDDTFTLHGSSIGVRALQQAEQPTSRAEAVSRVAINLRGVARAEVTRGDVLLTPGAWSETSVIDVALPGDPSGWPCELMLHVGTTAVAVHVRPLASAGSSPAEDPERPSARVARLRLARPLPLRAGDRAILRDPGAHRILGGVLILDVEVTAFTRRGAAARRAEELANGRLTLFDRLQRVGAVLADPTELDPGADRGVHPGIHLGVHPGIHRVGRWLVSDQQWRAWTDALAHVVDAWASAHPLDPGLPTTAAVRALALPDAALLGPLATAADVQTRSGRLLRHGSVPTLGPAEDAVRSLEDRLATDAFRAPERPELDAAGLGRRELAVAVATGRLLSIGPDIYLRPDAPAQAMRILAALEQPFTLSAARQALATTRRVAVPLLEYLDGRKWTERVDADHRRVAG